MRCECVVFVCSPPLQDMLASLLSELAVYTVCNRHRNREALLQVWLFLAAGLWPHRRYQRCAHNLQPRRRPRRLRGRQPTACVACDRTRVASQLGGVRQEHLKPAEEMVLKPPTGLRASYQRRVPCCPEGVLAEGREAGAACRRATAGGAESRQGEAGAGGR